MVILTNIRLPPQWRSRSGICGKTLRAGTWPEFRRQLRHCDLVLVNAETDVVFRLVALMTIAPWLRRPLVAADMILRKPRNLRERASTWLQRRLLARVDHFINHFQDLSGYQRWFGIGPERSSFVPFKPNLRDHIDVAPNAEGDYVLAYGFSQRDFDTFFSAVEHLPYPAAIVRPDFDKLRIHRSKFTRPLGALPPQVRLLEHDPTRHASQVEVLMGARIVVIPILKECLQFTGSAYNAMLLGKCVIISDGPATRGVIADATICVPTEDPAALAAAIQRVWEDDALRRATAARGYALAYSLGGVSEYVDRQLEAVMAWKQHARLPHGA